MIKTWFVACSNQLVPRGKISTTINNIRNGNSQTVSTEGLIKQETLTRFAYITALRKANKDGEKLMHKSWRLQIPVAGSPQPATVGASLKVMCLHNSCRHHTINELSVTLLAVHSLQILLYRLSSFPCFLKAEHAQFLLAPFLFCHQPICSLHPQKSIK